MLFFCIYQLNNLVAFEVNVELRLSELIEIALGKVEKYKILKQAFSILHQHISGLSNSVS
jgi:hypothetical protein